MAFTIAAITGSILGGITSGMGKLWGGATKRVSRASKSFRKLEYRYAKSAYPKGTTKAQAKKIEARRREKSKRVSKGIYGDVKRFGQSASKVMMKMDVVNPIEIAKGIMDSMYRVTFAILAIAGVAGMIYISRDAAVFEGTLDSIGKVMHEIGAFWILIVLMAYKVGQRLKESV